MLKNRLFFVAILVNISFFAQNSNFLKIIDSLKKEDNLSEFIYVHLDEYAKDPTQENLKIFEKLSFKIWRNSKGKTEITSQLYFYINYAYYLKQFGLLNQSIINYEKAFDFYTKNNITNYDIIEYCLKPLANNYTRIGDIERAEDILKVTIEKAQKDKRTDYIIATYLNLAAVLRTKGEFNSAINYLNLGLKLSSNSLEKSKLYSDVAINFFMKEDLIQAEKYVRLSNNFNTSNNLAILAKNEIILGSCFLKNNNYSNALNEFNSGLKNSIIVFGKNDREVAKIYNQLAEVYSRKNELENAQKMYQKALSVLVPKYKPKSIFENPTANYFYPENTLKDSFDGRANVFIEAGNYKEALKNYELAFLVEDELRTSYLTQNSKLIQQQENRNRSEKCIELCYFLFEETNDVVWVEKAFLYAEKTKGVVLVEARELISKKLTIGNDSLFLKEKELLFKKAQLTKNIIIEQLKEVNANVTLLAKLAKESNSISTELQLLKQIINKEYPQLKTINSTSISVEEIKQKLLLQNQLLMEFFEGKYYVYTFSIEMEKPIAMQRIEKTTSFTHEIEAFLSFFSDGRGAVLQNNIKEYTNLGNTIYEKLFNNTSNKNIILIPDGLISFIPFDALITEKTAITNFEKLPYLIKKSTINYAYSATLLLQEKSEKKIGKDVLGFFPVFKNNHRGLSELSYTLSEFSTIKNELNGNYLVKADASKQAFEKLVVNYPIVHLSTHASAGSYYEPPAIEFYDETLYLPEIYGYNLQTDLLVLSACETGLGTLRKGEGAMSLARGFSYAGVKNLIVSLWKVNDKSTEKLMSGFYHHYNKTNNKGFSLFQSKLDYLSDSNISSNKKSPYYWASFIYIGEIDLENNENFNYWWILVAVLFLIAAFFHFKKK